jgi:hypothetical protein
VYFPQVVGQGSRGRFHKRCRIRRVFRRQP